MKGVVQSRLQRRRQRNGRHQVLIFVLLAVAIVGVVVAGVAYSLSGKSSNQANQSSIQSSSRTKHSGAKSSRYESRSSDSSKEDGSGSAASNTGETTTADVAQYRSLSGGYSGPNENKAYLNFTESWLTVYSDTGDVTGPREEIIDVLSHDDGSLVFHAKFQEGDGSIRYIAILLVPAGVKLEKNWQTGAALNDQSDSAQVRFAQGVSFDGGKNYDMSEAYETFLMSSPERSQYGKVLYYKE